MIKTHQEIGNALELFFINETSPGSIFWKPRGALLFNNLIKLIRGLYYKYGYTEVVTPNIFEKQLWETSGHWDKYRENMFILENHHHSDKNEETEENNRVYSLKPMGCPSHCLIFKEMRPFSKDLPIRMAEFGVLHRNESSGSLHGLTRVRRFQQDDAHIFCRFDQIKDEVMNTLKMIDSVYGLFGMPYTMKLSTRPEEYIGTIELWDQAEDILKNVICEITKKEADINPGDGAFYGPKIDVTLTDKYGRNVQCGTIQLDFNLPQRFDLFYINESDQTRDRPVIVHRAVLGSVERFTGILLEHTQGKLPIQVSPYPILITTINKDFSNVAYDVKRYIEDMLKQRNVNIKVDVDDSADDIRTKIKSSNEKHYCYVLTIGKREAEAIKSDITTSVISVRKDGVANNMNIIDIINVLEAGIENK